MQAKELIGKFVTRIKKNKTGDGSFMGEKMFIVDATDDYIIVDFVDCKGYFLEEGFCDCNWMLYSNITEAEKKIEQQIEMGKIFIK